VVAVVVLVLVVFVRRRSLRLRPRWLESTGPGLPYIAKRMFKVFRMFYRYVASVSYGVIAKLDRDVADATMLILVCCKLLFPMFHLFFSNISCKCIYLDVAYVSHICCKCFIWMCYVYNGFKCFSDVLQMFQTYVSNVLFVLRRMLEVLHLNVLKVDQVLHITLRLLLPRLGVRHGKRAQAEAVPAGAGGPHVHAWLQAWRAVACNMRSSYRQARVATTSVGWQAQ
jgi:hypothetical protein